MPMSPGNVRLISQAIAFAIASLCCLQTSTAEPVTHAPQTHTIVIEAMQFNPASLTVRRGDRIVWRNNDLVPHTATAKGAFNSGAIAANESWAYVARSPAASPYVCAFHPTMTAILIVQ
jgi:plastocyanin